MKSFSIGELHPNSPHLFADLAELLLLVGYNGRSRLHANDLEALLVENIINADEIDQEEEENQAQTSSAARNSRRDLQIEDVMTHLAYRDLAFGAWYPFNVSGEMLEAGTGLTDTQRIYRLLLACSRLRSFGRSGLPQRWAKAFTRVARVAMAGLAPATANTRIFDANSDDRKHYYGTDLSKALRIMGRDLGVLHINEEECDKAGSSGDGGFDLIANLHFDDGAATAYAILGQCGAQETDWPQKTLEAHSLNCRSYFQIQFEYPSAMLTPICYRTATGEWVNNKSANGILLVDRLRIIHLIGAQQNCATQIVANQWFADFEAEFFQFSEAST